MNKIVWYPGHMTKAKRKIEETLPLIDAVVELLDARIPLSSQNPDFDKLFKHKPRLTLLNKCTLADDKMTEKWVRELSSDNRIVIPIDCKTKKNIQKIKPAIEQLLSEKLERYKQKNMNKSIKVMIAGITNVGKSTFINTLSKSAKAKTEDRPGVTRSNQWIHTDFGLDLLDTPGLLWHKFEDQNVGIKLACIGSIRDGILDTLTLSCHLIGLLRNVYAEMLKTRYKIEYSEQESNLDIFTKIARKRGFIMAGNEIDEERCAAIILDEFRAAKIGKITLDNIKG